MTEEDQKRKEEFMKRASDLRAGICRETVLLDIALYACDLLLEKGVTHAEGCKVRAYAEKIWGVPEALGMFGNYLPTVAQIAGRA